MYMHIYHLPSSNGGSVTACSHRRRGRVKTVLSCRVGNVNNPLEAPLSARDLHMTFRVLRAHAADADDVGGVGCYCFHATRPPQRSRLISRGVKTE